MKIIIVGCSFVNLLTPKFLEKQYPGIEFVINGSAGSGNRAIAATVVNMISSQQPDAVVVLWSGINRIDAPIPIDLHNTYNLTPCQAPYRIVGDQVWHHSGGFGCGGFFLPTPPEISNYFKIQHLGETPEYFTDLSLIDIIGVNAILKTKNLIFYSGFIYDIHADYSDYADILLDKPLEHTLGRISDNSKLYSLVQWDDMQLENTPFEWANDRDCLDKDQFHPTSVAMHQWFDLTVMPNLGMKDITTSLI